MGWFSWFFIKIRCVNRNPVRNTVMMTTRWPREWWILLWFCSFPLEFSKDRNDQKSHAKTQYRSGSTLSIFSHTLQVALNKKSGSNSQFWFLHISDNFFLRSGSLTTGHIEALREKVIIFSEISRQQFVHISIPNLIELGYTDCVGLIVYIFNEVQYHVASTHTVITLVPYMNMGQKQSSSYHFVAIIRIWCPL